VPRRIVPIEDTPRSLLGKILRKQVRDRVLPTL
jgi:long-chain acyl-CoA synthetase